jgi:hypothetical protein
MDLIDKKEKLADLIEEYIQDNNKEQELISTINEFSNDIDFRGIDLFTNIFDELIRFLPELSRKELKQRALMIRSYME